MKITLKSLMIVLMTFLLSQSLLAEKISTNLKAEYGSASKISKNLKANGFIIVGGSKVAKKSTHQLLIITHKNLKKFARKDKRGFAAVLRVLINKKKKEVVVTNPRYFMRAFLQKDFKKGSAKPIMDSLKKALGDLKPMKDAMDASKLKGYHFMVAMPYYQDFETVGKGTPDELLEKITKSKRLLFKLDLSTKGKKRYLVGVILSKKIEKFNKKLKTMHKATMLPYMVLLEGKTAKIMHAKYYLAISLPTLTMGQFMKISSVPDTISRSIKKAFK